MTNIIRYFTLVVDELRPKGHLSIVDASDDFPFLEQYSNVYINSQMSQEVFDRLLEELENHKIQPKGTETFVIIPDLAVFLDVFAKQAESFKLPYTEGPRYGLHFVIAGLKSTFFKTDSIIKLLRDDIDTILVGLRIYDQSLVKHKEVSREAKLDKDQLYFYNKGNYQKVKIIYQEEIGE